MFSVNKLDKFLNIKERHKLYLSLIDTNLIYFNLINI